MILRRPPQTQDQELTRWLQDLHNLIHNITYEDNIDKNSSWPYEALDGGDGDTIYTVVGSNYLKLDQTTPQTTIGTFTFPSVVATNYLNTPKIYPSADSTTAIQILKANGTTSILNVDTTNSRVGIGTTGPSQKLSVVGDIGLSGANRFIGTTDNYALSLKTNNSDRVYITNSGNVGIGTTAPASLLHISENNTNAYNNTGLTVEQLGAGDALIDIKTAATRWLVGIDNSDSGDAFKIGAGSTWDAAGNVMTLQSGGKVGIGTTSPLAPLTVNSSAYGSPATSGTTPNGVVSRLQSTSGNVVIDSGIIGANGAWVKVTNKTDLSLKYPLLLQPDGNSVVIGSTSTYGTGIALDVYGSSFPVYRAERTVSSTPKTFYSTNNFVTKATGDMVDGFGGGVVFSVQDDTQTVDSLMGSIGAVRDGADNKGALVFNTYDPSFGERMRISTAGNVGIGTTSPGGKAHINGTVDDQQLIVEAHSTQTNNIIEIHDSSSNVLVSFNGVGGAVINEQGSATGDFRVESDTEANMIFLDANGSTDGELYLGGTTNGVKILKGGSLSFIGTAGITDATNIPFGSTTGTKIGTGTTQKLGFWNTTPVVQPAHIADPAGGATIDTEARAAIVSINAMLAATGLTAAA